MPSRSLLEYENLLQSFVVPRGLLQFCRSSLIRSPFRGSLELFHRFYQNFHSHQSLESLLEDFFSQKSFLRFSSLEDFIQVFRSQNILLEFHGILKVLQMSSSIRMSSRKGLPWVFLCPKTYQRSSIEESLVGVFCSRLSC